MKVEDRDDLIMAICIAAILLALLFALTPDGNAQALPDAPSAAAVSSGIVSIPRNAVMVTAPGWQRFWTKGTMALVLGDFAAKAADAWFTHHNMESHMLMSCTSARGVTTCRNLGLSTTMGHEADPIARPFVRNTAAQVAYFGLSAGADLGIAYLLHRGHHEKLSRIVLGIGIANSGVSAGWSAKH